MFHGYTSFHIANILVHILAGVLAIVCGTTAIVSAKGKPVHLMAGWFFVCAYIALVMTAVVGIAIFEFRAFLGVAIIASSYNVFAGYRSLRLRGRRPQPIDITLSVVAQPTAKMTSPQRMPPFEEWFIFRMRLDTVRHP